ncbi:uncharacterized protein RHOBADRAFT_52318 [Rhodotorula graminis WP1]|uniref:Calcium-channel protein CCH1 n=1 Tax=Rhodotorula graminis (strain WP1) TaxID=578459 RepID=A0A194S6S1_RHOGW|nr:uncharacterized protein RHOBADRAFT_52318 [Rhodotorula graminis WP1]KPV76292.1 hypothetical protein RHOBADRAFT_52318 [Rhodotorula graminis WP1]
MHGAPDPAQQRPRHDDSQARTSSSSSFPDMDDSALEAATHDMERDADLSEGLGTGSEGTRAGARSRGGTDDFDGAVHHALATSSPAGAWREFRSDSPEPSPRTFEPRRAPTVDLRDGTVVRTLPQPPAAAASSSSRPALTLDTQSPSAFSTPAYDARDWGDPFLVDDVAHHPSASLFHDHSPAPRASHQRVDSHPLSLAPSIATFRTDDSSFSRLPDHDDGDDGDEEAQARSPLHPTSFPSSPSRPSPHRESRTAAFLQGLAASSTRRLSLSAGGRSPRPRSRSPSPGRDDPAAGWHELLTSASRRTEGDASASASALKRRSTLSAAAAGMRRLGVRVVNLADADSEEMNQVDLDASLRRSASRATAAGDGDVEAAGDEGEKDEDEDDEWEKRYEAREEEFRHLRGKTLGVFGPESSLRRACARVLTARWTEPCILVIIVVQVVVQTIQAAPDVYEHPRPTKGYFHAWEDWALFACFCLYTVELVGRIVVTGLVINPPRPPTPPELFKPDIYSTPKRSPSLVTKIQSRLSPLPSPQASPTAHRAPPFPPSPSRRSPVPSPGRLSPLPPSPTNPSHLPPPSSTDITAVDQAIYSTTTTNASSVALMRGDSTSSTVHAGGPSGVGLGLGSSAPLTAVYPPHSVRAGLASAFPAATAPAGANSGASTRSVSSDGWGPSPFSSATTPYALSVKRQRATYQQAFLRHSWNRIDAVAVVAFWISFALAVAGREASDNLWFIRALSVLRASRLLAITAAAGAETYLASNAQTILHSLKRAAPLLVRVGLFVAFAMILFSIIGVQAFRGSWSRNCVWVDPAGVLANVTMDQPCGSYLTAAGERFSYLTSDGSLAPEPPKGFTCAAPSICVETGNPANGAWSFDNIFAALVQVVVLASANTWTDIMYAMMQADLTVSALYFIVAVVILDYFLLNLLVAVITSTFGDIRSETKHSAFANASAVPAPTRFDDDKKAQRRLGKTASVIGTLYRKTRLIWPALIVASVALQADRDYDMDPRKSTRYEWIELAFTLAFDVEIAIRLFASLPDWRSFFAGNANRVDTFLAVVTTFIQLPFIFHSPAYAWLTFFQIARFYRVVLAIPRMRRLLVRLAGTFVGVLNMLLFLLLVTFLSALVAVQFLRGIPDPDSDDTGQLNYFQIYNAFLAQYQILSSENWTDPLKTVLSSQRGQVQIAITAIFICGWMLFAFFVIGNLFIALLNENWQLEEDEKRARQLEAYVTRTNEPGQTVTAGWFKRFDPYTLVTSRLKARAEKQSEQVPHDEHDEPVEILDRMVTASPEPLSNDEDDKPASSPPPTHARNVSFAEKAKRTLPSRLQTGFDSVRDYIAPHSPLDPPHAYSLPRGVVGHSRQATLQDLDRVEDVTASRQQAVAQYIVEHPTYDRALGLFSQRSPVRRACQALVEPAYGAERINGRAPNKLWQRLFQIGMLVVILASVGVAGSATPLYRRDYYLEHGEVRLTWYNVVEVATGFCFLLEFLVKVVADGLFVAPNAYVLSVWNLIDFWVLATVLANVVMVLMNGPSSSRWVRALKAFRALRLINLWPTMRQTFYNILIVGLGRILDASLLAVLYIIPFAVWGQNVFAGLLYSCNDDAVTTKAQCVGEYLVAVTDDWSYLAPRVWANPYVWSFDSFRSALLILFEIPEENASQFSGLFFVLYNLVGATLILTVFVSVIIASFTRRSGDSLLTTAQRQWQDLRRYLARQEPQKRPPVRAWCYDRAIHKHGWWSRGLTALYVLNTIVLATQATTTERAADAYNYIFLGFTVAYLVDVVVRLIGLGRSFFQNGWNLYDLVIISGTVATTLPIVANATSSQAAIQLQKVFLVALVFKLVQRNDQLHQLFKTAVASLPALLNIFTLYSCLFLFYAIFYLEVFGLTRWESAETHLSNYYTFANTLVLLALQSTGEGWNEYMHDYTTEWPFCTSSPFYLFDDCGSAGWAYALFITWNVLSMYLFVNIILGVVVQSFSFVYQEHGAVTRVSRAQLRHYKSVWARCDPERTGFIQPKDVGLFLHRLSGVFEVKIYRDEWSVASLRAGSYLEPTYHTRSPSFHHFLTDRDALSLQRVDLDKLRSLCAGIDEGEVAARRRNFVHVYHEAMHDAEETLKGISFTRMLTLVAHYRLVTDDSALQLDELAERQRKQQLVSYLVDNDRVRSFLRMVVLRRRFLDHLATKAQQPRASGAPNVPVINVTVAGASSPSPQRSPLAHDASSASSSARPPSPPRTPPQHMARREQDDDGDDPRVSDSAATSRSVAVDQSSSSRS